MTATLTDASINWKAQSVDYLNKVFEPLHYKERIELLYEFFYMQDVLVTTSFGANSVFLLHLLHQVCPEQRVFFINTTYHFKETLAYKDYLTQLYDLNLIEVFPQEEENRMTTEEKWWMEHPKMCCTINKVVPLEPIKAQHKIWMSGLMAYQTEFRSNLRIFEQQGDIIKFHPLIDMEEGEFLYQVAYNKLPRHPLEKHGYSSIGCEHCTAKGEGREGRWKGTEKKECGLHSSYFVNKLEQKS